MISHLRLGFILERSMISGTHSIIRNDGDYNLVVVKDTSNLKFGMMELVIGQP